MLTGLVLVALLVVAGTADRTGLLGVIGLVGLSLLWFLANGRMEGETLLRFTDQHGLTAGDLTGFAGLGLAVWRFRRWAYSGDRRD